jgi:hypothetical protein
VSILGLRGGLAWDSIYVTNSLASHLAVCRPHMWLEFQVALWETHLDTVSCAM